MGVNHSSQFMHTVDSNYVYCILNFYSICAWNPTILGVEICSLWFMGGRLIAYPELGFISKSGSIRQVLVTHSLILYYEYYHPETHLTPWVGYFAIVHTVKCISQVFRHDNSTIDSQFEISQRNPNQRYNLLHSINLLSQENIHRLKMTHLL